MTVIKLVYLNSFDSLQATKLYSCTAPELPQEWLQQMQWVDRHAGVKEAKEKPWDFSSGNVQVAHRSILRKKHNYFAVTIETCNNSCLCAANFEAQEKTAGSGSLQKRMLLSDLVVCPLQFPLSKHSEFIWQNWEVYTGKSIPFQQRNSKVTGHAQNDCKSKRNSKTAFCGMSWKHERADGRSSLGLWAGFAVHLGGLWVRKQNNRSGWHWVPIDQFYQLRKNVTVNVDVQHSLLL